MSPKNTVTVEALLWRRQLLKHIGLKDKTFSESIFNTKLSQQIKKKHNNKPF